MSSVEEGHHAATDPQALLRHEGQKWATLLQGYGLFHPWSLKSRIRRRLTRRVHETPPPFRAFHALEPPTGKTYLATSRHQPPPGVVRDPEGLAAISAAGGAFLRTKRARGADRGLDVSCSFRGAAVTGHSFEAGLAAHLVMVIFHLFGRRERYTLHPGTAISGRIRRDGRILPVDMDGLRTKIEACTYSSVQRFVVPREQAEEGRSYAAAIHRKALLALESEGRLPTLAAAGESSPGRASRPVEIIGVTALSELFSDRRITAVKEVSPAVHAAEVAWSWRRPLASTLILALLALVAWLLWTPLDRNPYSAALEGQTLEIRNAEGAVLDTLTVGSATAASMDASPGLAGCADLDGDGTNETIWAQQYSDSPNGATTVRCRTVRPRENRWEFMVERPIPYPTRPVNSGTFFVRELLVSSPLSTGARDVFVNAAHFTFPSLLIRLDGRNGAEKGTYLHAGHLADVVLVDLNGDGSEELLACGINNAFHEAVVLVLDPLHMTGAGPGTEEDRPEGWATGIELAYLRIPRTPVSLAVPEERYNRAAPIELYPSSRTFRVTVQDQSEVRAYRATVDLLFTFDLRVINIDREDDYDIAAQRLVEEGRLPAIPDGAALDAVARSVRHLRQGAWTTGPPPAGWR